MLKDLKGEAGLKVQVVIAHSCHTHALVILWQRTWLAPLEKPQEPRQRAGSHVGQKDKSKEKRGHCLTSFVSQDQPAAGNAGLEEAGRRFWPENSWCLLLV